MQLFDISDYQLLNRSFVCWKKALGCVLPRRKKQRGAPPAAFFLLLLPCSESEQAKMIQRRSAERSGAAYASNLCRDRWASHVACGTTSSRGVGAGKGNNARTHSTHAQHPRSPSPS
jgi:hypothetical protein